MRYKRARSLRDLLGTPTLRRNGFGHSGVIPTVRFQVCGVEQVANRHCAEVDRFACTVTAPLGGISPLASDATYNGTYNFS